MKQWIVIQGESKLGPYEAHEVRRLLYEGEVDLFDQIQKVGDTHVRTLADVDDVFAVDHVEYTDTRLNQVSGSGFEPETNEKSSFNETGRSQYTIEMPAASAKYKPRGQNAKKYYLVKKGREFGPYSSKDIRDKYYRSKLHKVSVRRSGSKKLISVEKFVDAYSTKSSKKRHDWIPEGSAADLAAMQKIKKTEMGYQLPKGDRTKEILPYIVGGLSVIAIIMALFVYSSPESKQQTRKIPNTRSKSLVSVKKQPQSSYKLPTSTPKKKAQKPKKKVTFKKKPKRTTSNFNRKTSTRKSYRTPKLRVTPKRKAVYRPVRKPAPVVRAKPKPRPVARVKPKSSIADKIGQKIEASSSYSLSQLEACAPKCQLSITHKGVKMTAVFFKIGFEDDLMARRGRAIFVGKLSGSKTKLTLIVSDVK